MSFFCKEVRFETAASGRYGWGISDVYILDLLLSRPAGNRYARGQACVRSLKCSCCLSNSCPRRQQCCLISVVASVRVGFRRLFIPILDVSMDIGLIPVYLVRSWKAFPSSLWVRWVHPTLRVVWLHASSPFELVVLLNFLSFLGVFFSRSFKVRIESSAMCFVFRYGVFMAGICIQLS